MQEKCPYVKPYVKLAKSRKLKRNDLPADLAQFYSEYEGVYDESSEDDAGFNSVYFLKLHDVRHVRAKDILVLRDQPDWKYFSGIQIAISRYGDSVVYVCLAPTCNSGAIMLLGPDVAGPGGWGPYKWDPTLVLAPSFGEWLKHLRRSKWCEYGVVPGSIQELPPEEGERLCAYFHKLNPAVRFRAKKR
ncbi:MAG: hypothetical protein KatS3mg105_3229 [Gemmatales bacterium]|nr:MAG: hypothetical protein KatS3mg105_3229 [Gemmatales bacterium]